VSKNKDPHYAVKVEQAIAEKYGIETVQNPKANWSPEKEKEYLEQLKKLSQKENKTKEKTEKIEVDGFFINKKLINKKNKRKCEFCNTYSFNLKDDVYFNKFDCCYDCYVKWIEHREERWNSGWRPNNK